MARKIHAFKTPPAARGSAAVSSRQPQPRPSALYLEQLRLSGLKTTPLPPRQQIAVQVEEQSQEPRVVKIIHTDSN